MKLWIKIVIGISVVIVVFFGDSFILVAVPS